MAAIKKFDDIQGGQPDIWPSVIDVKNEKQAARDLLKLFKNPKDLKK